MGLAGCEDEEWRYAENQRCADEEHLKNNQAPRIDLAWREETDDHSESGTEYSEKRDNPHSDSAARDSVDAGGIWMFMMEDKPCDEHENIHQHV